NFEHPDCPFYVMGRYFGPSDPRHQLHALSLRLCHFKRYHTPHAELFTELYMKAIEAATGGAYDLITQVPSRPEVGDRLAHILTLLKSKLPTPPTTPTTSTPPTTSTTPTTSTPPTPPTTPTLLAAPIPAGTPSSPAPPTPPATPTPPAPPKKPISPAQLTETGEILPELFLPDRSLLNQIPPSRIQPNILRCVKSYPPLKALNLQARKAAITKVFEVQKDVRGKHLVIIDDIVTTGATINACIAELKAAGAASIKCVFLAYHPYALRPRPDKSNHTCTECGERLGVTFGPSQLFFQCPKQNDINELHSKMSFNDAFTHRFIDR
ncbi:MAG: phosphoribosyltransferase, partial [Candidatus Melainabacteria bacterium]|nr:phosphoribosyltransferase [Candidatus Melainabacteria bacterium]